MILLFLLGVLASGGINPIYFVAIGPMIAAVIGPLLLAQLNAKQSRASKLEDYRRQDEVATKAKEVADAQAAAAMAVANAAALTSKKAAQDAAQAAHALTLRQGETDQKLDILKDKVDVVHTLVNSQLSAAIKGELDSKVSEVAMVRELIDLKAQSGNPPSVETLEAVQMLDARITELKSVMFDRAETLAASQVQTEQQAKSESKTEVVQVAVEGKLLP